MPGNVVFCRELLFLASALHLPTLSSVLVLRRSSIIVDRQIRMVPCWLPVAKSVASLLTATLDIGCGSSMIVRICPVLAFQHTTAPLAILPVSHRGSFSSVSIASSCTSSHLPLIALHHPRIEHWNISLSGQKEANLLPYHQKHPRALYLDHCRP